MVAENFINVREELDSCCQGLEANPLLSHTRFHMDLQLLVSVVLLMMYTRRPEKGKKCYGFSCVSITQKIHLSHILC